MVDALLRFCLVGTFYPPYSFGGDGVYSHRLANGLARLGHSVTVLHSPSAYRMLAGRQPDGTYCDHPNVTVRPIKTPLGALGLLAVQQTGRPGLQGPALRRWLHREAYDVIHYNNVSLLGGPHVFRYGRGLKLCTLHEHWLVCPMHVLWKFDREVCTKPTCIRCTLHGRRPPQWWRYTGLMRRAVRHVDAFIGPSLFTMRMHRERGLDRPMVQLPGFDAQPAASVESQGQSANGGRPYFLFVGRLEKIKGVQTILPAFRTRLDVDLLIVGAGNYESTLRTLAADAPNVRFLGRLDHQRLHELYGSAIATVVPSLCYETFGIIVAESFAAGTPVIVRAQSALEELVTRHGGGLMFRTERELEGALDAVRGDAELRTRLGREGRVVYESEFAERPFLRHYLAVVRRLLAEKRAGNLRQAWATTFNTSLEGRPVLV